MDTTHAATTQIRRSNIGTTGAATWTSQPWQERHAITAKGNDCGARGTHITPSQTILCKSHAGAKYAVDCR